MDVMAMCVPEGENETVQRDDNNAAGYLPNGHPTNKDLEQLPAQGSGSTQNNVTGDGNKIVMTNITNVYYPGNSSSSKKKKRKKKDKDKKKKKETGKEKKKRKNSSSESENNPPKKEKMALDYQLNAEKSETSTTFKKLSNLSAVTKTKSVARKSICVRIHDIEVESSYMESEKKWLPARFRIVDSKAWAYLTVFGKARRRYFKAGESLLIQHVQPVKDSHIKCNIEDIERHTLPVEVNEKIINRMNIEEEFSPLAFIKMYSTYQKTRLLITEVGKVTRQHVMNKKPYKMRMIKVQDASSPGVIGKEIHPLRAFNKAAQFRYKKGKQVVICGVKYHKPGKEFRTVGECHVKKIVDDQ